jgi:hypothetical protein
MRFIERLSTVICTCRVNGINMFNFLVEMISVGFAEKHNISNLNAIPTELNRPGASP